MRLLLFCVMAKQGKILTENYMVKMSQTFNMQKCCNPKIKYTGQFKILTFDYLLTLIVPLFIDAYGCICAVCLSDMG